MKKIVVIGPESTGKSTTAERLAAHYNTQWVAEYARQYIDELQRPYEYDDLLYIAMGQIGLEESVIAKAEGILFCDTDLIVCKIWSEHSYGKVHRWTLNQIRERKYDFYLLMNIDMPWEPDPQREHPHLRQHFMEKYQQELEYYHKKYALISGHGEERFKNAVAATEEFLHHSK